MTVRAWFTISALVLAALAGAFAFRLFAPVAAPEIRVRAGDTRLHGVLVRSCWPERGQDLRCETHRADSAESTSLPDSGTLRFNPPYPVEPRSGSIEIKRDGDVVVRKGWMRTLRYELPPDSYVLTAEARYPGRAFVRYVFRFTVTRSGS